MCCVIAAAVVASGVRIPGALPPVTSIAVLPFLDLSPEHQSEYLSDGLTDELTNQLAMVNGLRVVARTSAFRFKGKSPDVREIGRSLGVGAIVEGSVLRDGSQIRVIVQLARTSDGTHLWQAQYDREIKDLFGVQDEITRSVAEALRVRLTGAPAAGEFDPGERALNEYLQGRYGRRSGSRGLHCRRRLRITMRPSGWRPGTRWHIAIRN